jgi:hypothetical protein
MMGPKAHRFKLEIAIAAIAPKNFGARLGSTTRLLMLLSDPLDRLARGAGGVIQEAFADRLGNARAVQTALREQLGRIPMINEPIGEAQL